MALQFQDETVKQPAIVYRKICVGSWVQAHKSAQENSSQPCEQHQVSRIGIRPAWDTHRLLACRWAGPEDCESFNTG